MIKLWVWRNGPGQFVAYDDEYPCHDNGDPKTLGEPIGVAVLQPYEKSAASVSAYNALAGLSAEERDTLEQMRNRAHDNPRGMVAAAVKIIDRLTGVS